jgi:hypothetical protein
MTGRGAGFCRGYGMPGYANGMPGRGFGWAGRGGGRGGGRGFGGGFGRGFRNRYWAAGTPGWANFGPFPGPGPVYGTDMTREEEIETLRQQAETFKAGLKDIERRLESLETGDD